MPPLVFLQATGSEEAAAAATSTVAAETGFWDVMLNAPPEVKFLVVTLIVMFLVSFFIMGVKAVRMFSASRQSQKFLDQFWGDDGGAHWEPQRLETLYSGIKAMSGSPVAKVFHAGYVELARVSGVAKEDSIENIERALRRASVTEMTKLEALLPFLATTGSTAPFIGLLGTVLGILDVFNHIGGGDGSLEVIGPKIAEALYVTAVGLAAAIPAVMAYNYFIRRIRVLESEVETFAHDYLNIVKRHFL
ncbi:MAG: MotA/TolQ/ExbB proton channel family protein [Sandaracinaceae bacterium]|nr:MAG: Tol-Pal system subunit TolQ [Sandaracinaceae bacterium]HBQ11565.1 Tol-Pal system subunit TolQ [Myxococcales bacterium]